VAPRQSQTSTNDETERKVEPVLEEAFFQARLGNHERAIPLFQQVLQTVPNHRRALFGLGTSYIAMQKYAEATNVLWRSIQLDRSDYYALNNLAWIFAAAQDIRFRDGKRAIQLAQEALLHAPTDYRVWSTLAEAYYIAGEYARARRAAEEALRIVQQLNLPTNTVQEYQQQVQRCRAAEQAMNILE
jgi:Flp pilus assembly protein TadD